MSNMELLGALEAEKLTKQKWEQYCGTRCSSFSTEFKPEMAPSTPVTNPLASE